MQTTDFAVVAPSESAPLTWASLQLRAAFCLARAFGHEWACGPYGILESSLVEYDMADPAAACAAIEAGVLDSAREDGDSDLGICAPTVSGGSLIHTTTTGRLRWQIDPDGISLEIHRPAGRVAALRGTWADGWSRAEVTRDIRPRHVAALRQAMSALPWIAGAAEALASASALAERRMLDVLTAHADRLGLDSDVQRTGAGWALDSWSWIVGEAAEEALGWVGRGASHFLIGEALREGRALIEARSTSIRIEA